MGLVYKQAGIADIDDLVESRIVTLIAANELSADEDMEKVRSKSREYYKKALSEHSHIAYLVYDGDKVVGCGGVSFFSVMPTYHNISGEKAYIMNMYTAPEYRRQGIASKVLELLVTQAKNRGAVQISLEATKMGEPLYQSNGFKKMNHEMELV